MRNKDIKKALDGYFAVLSSYQPVYSTYAGGIYEMELTRAAIHCFATHCSKLKPEVVGHAAPALGRILQFKPNPLMDTKKYLYRLATAYMTDNNALIAPLIEFDEIKGFYPLTVGKVQLMEHNGQTFVRYDMGGGAYFAVELERCGILNQFQYTSELWGESNLCLRPTLELMDAQTQGILNGIKNSAVIRFIAKLANALNPKDVKKEQERLKEINLGINNTAGVFVIDQKYEDVRQIDSKPYIINPSQMEYIKQNVFTYFGVNEHILQNCFTPDEWNAYYEGKIEPFALEIGLVHTNMTFTERERSFGNQIFFSTNRLQYASIQDKINYVVQMGDRGRTSINEDREVFNLPPIEGGDRHFIRGEYRPVDSYDEAVEPLTDGNETQPNGNSDTLDKAVSGGIMEKRDYIQNPDTGLMEGSTPEGGGSGGGGKSSGSDNESEGNPDIGKVEQVGTVDYSDRQAVMQKLSEAEKEFADLPYEKCRVVTADGQVWDVTGTSTTVNTSAIEEKHGVSLEGSSSYHNHVPSETYYSFSADDAGDFIAKQERTALASDHKYQYMMERTEATLSADFIAVYDDFSMIRSTTVLQMAFDGKIDMDIDGCHETMKILSRQYSFKYRRTSKNDK